MGNLLVLAEGKFGVLHSILDSKRRPFALFKIQIRSVSTESFSVNRREIDSPLVFLSEGLQGRCELFTLFRGFGEDVGERKFSLKRPVSTGMEKPRD